jgi:outer membrane biosynthesis protein TonB
VDATAENGEIHGMSRARLHAVSLLVLTMTTALASCRGCGGEAPTTETTTRTATSSDAATSSASAASARTPYLPSRSAPDDTSPEPLSLVEKVLFAQRPQLNECYRRASRETPALEGQAIIAVTIGRDGHVTDTSVVSQNGLTPALVTCLTGALKSAVFEPPASAPVTIRVPLNFKPRPDAGVPRVTVPLPSPSSHR